MDGQQYSNQVGEYIKRTFVDPRIIGLCVYTTDFGHPWDSFDTAPAHKYLTEHNVWAPAPQWGGVSTTEPEPPPVTKPPIPDNGKQAYAPPCGGYPISHHFNQIYNSVRHEGVDFETPIGTPIICTADGTVAYVGTDTDYGHYVRVFHGEFHSFYAHLSQGSVHVGQPMKRGDQIGLSGNTGNTTGPHLHYEIRLGIENDYAPWTPLPMGRVDPETFFAMVGQAL